MKLYDFNAVVRLRIIIKDKYHEEQCFNYFYKNKKSQSYINRNNKERNGF